MPVEPVEKSQRSPRKPGKKPRKFPKPRHTNLVQSSETRRNLAIDNNRYEADSRASMQLGETRRQRCARPTALAGGVREFVAALRLPVDALPAVDGLDFGPVG